MQTAKISNEAEQRPAARNQGSPAGTTEPGVSSEGVLGENAPKAELENVSEPRGARLGPVEGVSSVGG